MSPWPESVEAELNYLRDTGVRPVNYTYDPPPGVPRNSGEVDTRRVTVRNARLASQADLSLDSSGFQLLSHRSSLADVSACDDARTGAEDRSLATWRVTKREIVWIHRNGRLVLS